MKFYAVVDSANKVWGGGCTSFSGLYKTKYGATYNHNRIMKTGRWVKGEDGKYTKVIPTDLRVVQVGLTFTEIPVKVTVEVPAEKVAFIQEVANGLSRPA